MWLGVGIAHGKGMVRWMHGCGQCEGVDRGIGDGGRGGGYAVGMMQMMTPQRIPRLDGRYHHPNTMRGR